MTKNRLRQQLEQLYREQTGKMLAYLVSIAEDFSLAEEVWHATFEKAINKWPSEMPEHPKAWLATVARNLMIDHLRHRKLSLEKSRLIQAVSVHSQSELDIDNHTFPDQQLKLIFTCCHPAISFENQIALTLYSVCGLKPEQIAQALVITRSTLEQRMTRAKRKIKQSKIPFAIPPEKEISLRLNAVLKVIYLVFTTGFNEERYLIKPEVDLCLEAIRLAKLLTEIVKPVSNTEVSEVNGLLALMMFTLARRAARYKGEKIVLLEKQDRSLWDWKLIRQADHILTETLMQKKLGAYQLQAAIAGVHSLATKSQNTDWLHIEALYQILLQFDSSPVIKLNAAVATAFSRGYQKGLDLIDAIEKENQLNHYSFLYSAKADLLKRLGHFSKARDYYIKAKDLSGSHKETIYYQEQLDTLDKVD